MDKYDVVQFNENHKWCGCLGIIDEVRPTKTGNRYMVAMPIPEKGTAYIFALEQDLERIGRAVMVPKEE